MICYATISFLLSKTIYQMKYDEMNCNTTDLSPGAVAEWIEDVVFEATSFGVRSPAGS